MNHFQVFSAVKGKWNSDFIFTTHCFRGKAFLLGSLKDLPPFAKVRLIYLRSRQKGANIVSAFGTKTVSGAAPFWVAV